MEKTGDTARGAGSPRDRLVRDVLHRFDLETKIKIQFEGESWVVTVDGTDEGAEVALKTQAPELAPAVDKMIEVVKAVAGW